MILELIRLVLSLVFSKCADYMEEGRRLENLSWRLWTRETFCVDPARAGDTSVLPLLLRAETTELPPLSASVDSAASEADRIESHIRRTRSKEKPVIAGDESSLALLAGREKHITPSGLERMVLNIKQNKALEPLSPIMNSISTPAADDTPQPSSPTAHDASTYPSLRAPHHSAESCSTTALEGNDSDTVNSDGSNTSVSSSGVLSPTTAACIPKSPSIVRGFSPSHVSSSYRSNTRLAAEQRSGAKTANYKPSPIKKKGGMFTLGGSSGDDESSFEERMTSTVAHPHRSSLSEELSKPETRAAPPAPPVAKKVASFLKNPVEPIQERVPDEDEDAIETDEEDEISESAIEDEDDSDWEDSVMESGRSSPADKELFQRVDSRPDLVSRRSLLTMMMHQPTKMNAIRSTPALQRSRLASPNGPSDPNSAEEESNLTMRGPDVPRSKPIIVKPNAQASGAHSPRTTRRNMLATELTESLRRHLLWERQQKSTTANAVFKRRHTAHDMANLQEYPGPNGGKGTGPVNGSNPATQSKEKDLSKNGSWNNYNDYGPWEYHVKGW